MAPAVIKNQSLIHTSAIQELVGVLLGRQQEWHAGYEIRLEVALEALLQHGVPFADVVQYAISQLEHHLILQVLTVTNGNKVAAAKILKIDYKTLYRKMRKYSDYERE